jgi:cyclohexyl-isocyanide hydratase
MRVAVFIFPDLTELDAVGVFDPLARVGAMGIDPNCSIELIAMQEEIRGHFGATLKAGAVRPRLDRFDLLIIPGGFGTRALQNDVKVIEYLRTWGTAKPLATVCTGALLAASAGFLRGKRATTHHAAREDLAAYGVEVMKARIVEDGNVTTAAGVTAAIDLGLHLVEKHWGAAARERIGRQMEYPPGGDA